MAAVASHKLQKTLLARWRHAATAPIYSAAAGRLCQAEELKTNTEGELDPASVTEEAHGDASLAPQAAASPSGKRVKAKLVVLRESEHELSDKLPLSTWSVLRSLKDLGFDSYVVGGSVRDLLLKQVPKDYDVLSTADLEQVRRRLPHKALIVGKRFPICLVTSRGSVVEVSSFNTTLRTFGLQRPQKFVKTQNLIGVDDWDDSDFSRWENSQKRDFTVNGLMYDPFKKLVYDYVGGLEDLKRSKIRTVTCALHSFKEDPARILRAFRFAARLRFSLARDTARAVERQKHLIADIGEGRLAMETNMLMAYGAAERSIRILSRHSALELIFPLQAHYLRARNFNFQSEESNLLLDLLGNMDRVLAPHQPCHPSLWVLVLAFHLALSKRKRSYITAAAFALAVYHRTGLMEAGKKAKRILKKHKEQKTSFVRKSVMNELRVGGPSDECVLKDAEDLLDDVVTSLNRLASDTGVCSVITRQARSNVLKLVERARDTLDRGHPSCPKKKLGDFREDPERVKAALAGDQDEISYVFSRIVLNTLFPSHS